MKRTKRYEVMNLGTSAIERFGILFLGQKSMSIDLTKDQFEELSNIDNMSVMEILPDYLVKKRRKRK